jgi:hypothetical protein
MISGGLVGEGRPVHCFGFSMETLSATELLLATRRLVEDERRVCVAVLKNLREIERRRLYAEEGYSSLWEFTTRYLSYSEGAAHRRIAAMRLIKSLPEVEGKIGRGELSLTVAARVQDFVTREKAEPAMVLKAVEGKSLRAVELALAELAPQALPKERSRPVTATHTEIKILVDLAMKEKLDVILARRGRRNYGEAIRMLIDAEWAKIKKQREATTPPEVNNLAQNLPASVKRFVWRRDGGRCTFLEPATGRRWEADHFLEIDHIHPVALGGTHDPANLRLLCREHNLLAAAKIFGHEKMEKFRRA